ncbi:MULTISPECIES: hypothetical protein [Rhizobium/Agrobacterium group]
MKAVRLDLEATGNIMRAPAVGPALSRHLTTFFMGNFLVAPE